MGKHWSYHTANSYEIAKKIAKKLHDIGKDIRIKKSKTHKGKYTVWERD